MLPQRLDINATGCGQDTAEYAREIFFAVLWYAEIATSLIYSLRSVDEIARGSLRVALTIGDLNIWLKASSTSWCSGMGNRRGTSSLLLGLIDAIHRGRDLLEGNKWAWEAWQVARLSARMLALNECDLVFDLLYSLLVFYQKREL